MLFFTNQIRIGRISVRIRPEPDPNFFFKLGSGRTWIRTFFSNQNPAGTVYGLIFQIRIRLEPDPDFFFKLESGRNRIRTFFSYQDPAGSGYQTKMAISGRTRIVSLVHHQLLSDSQRVINMSVMLFNCLEMTQLSYLAKST